MKSFFISLFLAIVTLVANAEEQIKIYVVAASGPNNAKTPLLIDTIALINKMQSKYDLKVVFRPGANGQLALKEANAHPENTIVGVGSYVIKHMAAGAVDKNNFVYLPESGYDMCTAVNANVGNMDEGIASLAKLKGQTIVVGTNAIGAPDHVAALELAKQYDFKVRVAVFKSPSEAYMNMVGNNGVNFVFVGPNHYLKFKDKNPNLKILGINCDVRSVLTPDIKTVEEQGFNFPRAFAFSLVRKEMPKERRDELAHYFKVARDMLPKSKVLLYSSDPNWFEKRYIEQLKFVTPTTIIANNG